jgi:uroporphyrinogen-III synthase
LKRWTRIEAGVNTQALSGKHIWLTRPEEQNAALTAALRELGAEVFCLPLLEIVPVAPDAETRAQLLALDRYDIIIYISANAAKAGLDAIGRYWPQYPVHPANFSVGPTTGRILEQAGLTVRYPTERVDSEGLLALPELQGVAGKKALIVRGLGGRETLATVLRSRGCYVEYAELYGRRLPAHPRAFLQHGLEDCPPDAIVISSAEAMDNLQSLFREWYPEWTRLPLHVVSQRLVEQAGAAGYQHVVQMVGATDDAIMSGLLTALAGEAP